MEEKGTIRSVYSPGLLKFILQHVCFRLQYFTFLFSLSLVFIVFFLISVIFSSIGVLFHFCRYHRPKILWERLCFPRYSWKIRMMFSISLAYLERMYLRWGLRKWEKNLSSYGMQGTLFHPNTITFNSMNIARMVSFKLRVIITVKYFTQPEKKHWQHLMGFV